MGKKKRILFGVLVIAMVGILAWALFSSREPYYQGTPLSEWLEVYNANGKTQDDYAKTREAVEHISTNAIPTLLRFLRKKDPSWKGKWYELAQKQHIFKVKEMYAGWRNQEAAIAFRILGARASNAVPELIQIYEENITPASACETAAALGGIGHEARAAVPVFLKLLNSPIGTSDPRRAATVKALGEIGENAEQVVPVLIRCLGDKEFWVRSWACDGIENFGPEAKSATPIFLQWLQSSNETTRYVAARVLWRINPEAAAKAAAK